MVTKKKQGVATVVKFWDKVSLSTSENCWEWEGYVMPNGYGQLKTTANKNMYAHRYSYNLLVGDIPKGMLICHKCDNRKCVNPNHLFLGTHSDNTLDMVKKGRQVLGRRHKQVLKPKDVLLIRELHSLGFGSGFLAERFGLTSGSCVSNIVARRTWKNLENVKRQERNY